VHEAWSIQFQARQAVAWHRLAFPTVMVMQELPEPRPAHVLIRGQYDRPGKRIARGTPAALPASPKDAPANRLGLAQWIVAPANPLTARVAVNRQWQLFFGTGLVRTSEDFGTQGERPSHPELLDWLAREFVESGWDVKGLQRLIVTSATYRQSSRVTPELVRRDPDNRLLARGARFRLAPHMVRDQALATAGLLVEEIGGPSVKPLQPPGLWEELAGAGQKYVPGKGADLYRRSLYTYWKRTSPPPSLMTFDASDRETCTVRRPRTNTPLQALTLLNETTYVEAARMLAVRALRDAAAGDGSLSVMFQIASGRAPTADELAILRRAREFHRERFRKDIGEAAELLTIGDASVPDRFDIPDFAAHTVVASLILNLDEVVTRE
jgi:hypothetical protein